jgi:predicted ATPase/DNA-binding SARP family transcriptional activator
MPALSLTFLGRFHAEQNGESIHGFATDKSRALLAYLAVERGRPHRRENLAALLWPDQSDERARQSLRQALSHLKQALGGDEFLLISPQDIQINPHSDVWTDVGIVESLQQACKRHSHRSLEHCLPCLDRQEQLLRYYAGDFLAGFPSQNSESFEEWVMLTREHLHQYAMTAHNFLAGIYERRGDLAGSLKHIRQQIHLEPWREEAHRIAMRLLAQMGERSSALLQYQTCQRLLEKELAVSPSAETTALYEAIQKGNVPVPPTHPVPSDTSTSFVGRAREQAELADQLANPNCRLITILGMGGAGKSRLALQVARAHHGLYRDGIFFTSLVAVTDIRSAIAAELGFATPDAGSRLPELLRHKQILLVLDNFEHLVEDSEQLSELLSAAPDLQLIVTSRERLRLREEWVYTLDGLSYPTDDETADSGDFDSCSLFERRAAQANPRFRLTPDRSGDLSAICRLVEGHPLAIELAASLSAERSCREIAASLYETFDSLSPSLRNFPARHISLRVVFEYSWKLLTDDERNRLTKLSVFAGGFTLEAAHSVTGSTREQLANLTAKSLLRHGADGRYSLHESIRQFAAEKLEDDEDIRSRHAGYFSQWSADCDAAGIQILDSLQKEKANLRAAWKWSLEANISGLANLLKGLAMLYTLRGPIAEGETLLDEAIHHIKEIESAQGLQDSLYIELARLYNLQTRYEEAVHLVQNISESSLARPRVLLTWGQALSAQGECQPARPILEKALEWARQTGDRRVEADSLRELGNVANRLVEYDVAVPLYEQSLRLSRELGDKRGESATLNNWASVEWDLGELDAAHEHFENALALYRELGNLPGEAKALNNLSNVLADQGDLVTSIQYSEKALRIHFRMGNPRGQGAVLNNLGATYLSLGDYDKARSYYQKALLIHREGMNRQAEGETLANLSLLDCIQENYTSARASARKAIELSEKMGDKINLANAYYYLGRIELAEGNTTLAEEALHHALGIRNEVPHPGRLLEIQTELALAALKNSNPSLALERSTPIIEALTDPDVLDGTDEPFRIYSLIIHILSANKDKRLNIIREAGLSLYKKRASTINDQDLLELFRKTHTHSWI